MNQIHFKFTVPANWEIEHIVYDAVLETVCYKISWYSSLCKKQFSDYMEIDEVKENINSGYWEVVEILNT